MKNLKVKSIELFTFEAMDCDFIPELLHGIEVQMRDDESGEEERKFFFENYKSLDRFTNEDAGGIKKLNRKWIFYNYDRDNDRSETGRMILDSFVIAFNMQEIKPVVTRYVETREFGGSEEGGWYYSNYYPQMIVDAPIDDDGYVYYTEFFYGQHTKTDREYYS